MKSLKELKMCKALKQNPSERAKSYQHQVSDLFKDATICLSFSLEFHKHASLSHQ